MTLTFNANRYVELLSQYQPKLIKTEADNEQALKVVEDLMHRPNRSPEETALYELLIILIEKFEQEYYSPGAASTPLSMLGFLMEQRGLQPQSLVGVLGNEETVTRIMQGVQELSVTQAKALSLFFKVDATVFV